MIKKFNFGTFLNSDLPAGFSTALEFLGSRARYNQQINVALSGAERSAALAKIKEQLLPPVTLFSLPLDENILFFSSLQHDICMANKVEVAYIEEMPDENDTKIALSGHVFFRLLKTESGADPVIVLGDVLNPNAPPTFDDGHECYHASTADYTFTTFGTFSAIKEIVQFFLETIQRAEANS